MPSFMMLWRYTIAAASAPITVAVLVALAAGSPVYAQDHLHDHEAGVEVELDEIIELIEARNPLLRAAHLNAEALGKRPNQVSAWPDPTFGVSYQPFPILTAHGAQRTQWQVEQTVPYPGKLGLRSDIASLDAEAASLNAEALFQDLILEGKLAFVELYRLQELDQLVIDFESALEDFEEVAAVRYEVGQGTQQAVLKAQLEKNLMARRYHHIEGRRRQAAETLARLSNHPDGPRYFLTSIPRIPSPPDLDADLLTDAALTTRPEFAALEAAAQQAAKQIELSMKEAMPDFGLRVTYHDIARRTAPETATGRDAVAIGASIKIPLQRGPINARTDEARLRHAQVEAEQEALMIEYRTQIEELISSLEHEFESLELYESTLLPQATSTVDATQTAYATGTIGFVDLLEAERTLFSLRTEYIDAAASYLANTARLERVLGVRSLSDITNFAKRDILPSTPSSNIHIQP